MLWRCMEPAHVRNDQRIAMHPAWGDDTNHTNGSKRGDCAAAGRIHPGCGPRRCALEPRSLHRSCDWCHPISGPYSDFLAGTFRLWPICSFLESSILFAFIRSSAEMFIFFAML